MSIERLRKQLAEYRAHMAKFEAEAAAAEAIVERFPDANEEGDGIWTATGFTPDRVDPEYMCGKSGSGRYTGWSRFSYDADAPRHAINILYSVVKTEKGNGRIYLRSRVDIIEGVRQHQEDGVPLVQALLSTVGMAESAWAAKCAEIAEEKRKDEEKDAAKKRVEELKTAQPVRIVEQPADAN